MSAQHTPKLRKLAEAAQMMPWDKSQTDIPHSARWAFKEAITGDHYVQLLNQRDELLESLRKISTAENRRRMAEIARAAIAKATGEHHEHG